MDSINVNGVSFRWSDGQLLITTAHGQGLLSAASATQLLDFLAQCYVSCHEVQSSEKQKWRNWEKKKK